MPLFTETRSGRHEIFVSMGARRVGGVYPARKTKLDREVEIEPLAAVLAFDPGLPARFKREAKTPASLNHSNMAQIYRIEESTSVCTLVVELTRLPTEVDHYLRKAPCKRICDPGGARMALQERTGVPWQAAFRPNSLSWAMAAGFVIALVATPLILRREPGVEVRILYSRVNPAPGAEFYVGILSGGSVISPNRERRESRTLRVRNAVFPARLDNVTD
jgi:hypothetical protein